MAPTSNNHPALSSLVRALATSAAQNETMLIAGAGIAGLAMALALAKRGRPCLVLERRPQFHEEGAGIQIGPNGTRALAELGVTPHLEPHAARPDALVVMDGTSGGELARLPLGDWIRERHGSSYWTVHRADLHAALLTRVEDEPLITIAMSSPAESFEDHDGEGVRLRLEQGEELAGAGLIGADGLWSAIRSYAFPVLDDPAYAGRAAMRAVIPAGELPDGLEPNATHIWLSPGAHVVHYPVRAGSEIAIVVVTEDGEASDSWTTDVLPVTVRAISSSFPARLAELLAQPKAWRKWSLFTLPNAAGRRWVRGRMALAGDAAHPVLPFLAQGGVLALEDALVMGQCVGERPDDIAGAFAQYESRRRARAARVARASRSNGAIYHMSGLGAWARNSVLRTASPERLMQRYDWLYGWRV